MRRLWDGAVPASLLRGKRANSTAAAPVYPQPRAAARRPSRLDVGPAPAYSRAPFDRLNRLRVRCHETYFPAQRPQARSDPRVSRPHGDQERPQGPGRPPREGPRPPNARLNPCAACRQRIPAPGTPAHEGGVPGRLRAWPQALRPPLPGDRPAPSGRRRGEARHGDLAAPCASCCRPQPHQAPRPRELPPSACDAANARRGRHAADRPRRCSECGAPGRSGPALGPLGGARRGLAGAPDNPSALA